MSNLTGKTVFTTLRQHAVCVGNQQNGAHLYLPKEEGERVFNVPLFVKYGDIYNFQTNCKVENILISRCSARR